MTIFVTLTLAAVAALLLAEYVGSTAGVWVCKPLASTGFIATALAAGALDTTYGTVVVLGLLLSWLGDVLLIPRGAPAVFQAGVLSFLLGHVAFASAFVARGVSVAATLAAAVVAATVGVVIFRWLQPHVPDGLRAAAYAYMLVISVMVVAAAGTVAAAGNAAIMIGAVAFYLSDVSVARDRFVDHAFINRLWGLPLYYAAQLVLAFSVRADS